MNRVEKFREIRKNKRKITASLFLFLVILVSGIGVADYSVNNLMQNEKGINILSFHEDNGYFEVNFMNLKLYFNTMYLNRDYQRILDLLSKIGLA